MVRKLDFIYLFLGLFQLIKSQISSNDAFLLSSQPLLELSQADVCKTSGIIQKILQPTNLNDGQFLGWSNTCGMKLIDFQDLENIKVQAVQIDLVSASLITLDSDNNRIWVCYSDSFKIYGLKNILSPNLITTISRSSTTNTPQQLKLYFNANLFFIRTKTTAEPYWVQDLTAIKPLTELVVSESVNCLAYEPKAGYLFFGTERRIIGYKLTYQSNQLTYGPACKAGSNVTFLDLIFIDNVYLILQSKFLGLWKAELKDYFTTGNCNLVNLIYFQAQNSYIIMNYLKVTDNKLYLISEKQFLGIDIFEIQIKNDQLSLVLFQEIEANSISSDLMLSLQQNSLIRILPNTISIYRRIAPNYQSRVPNIQNGDQNVVYQETTTMVSDLSRRCYLKNNKFYFSKMVDGLYILKIDPITSYLSPILLYKPITGENYEAAMPLSDPTKLVSGVSAIHFVDLTDINNPRTIIRQDYGLVNLDVDGLSLSKDELTLFGAGGRQGLLIMNLVDFEHVTLRAQIYHPLKNYQSASAENVVLSQDEKYAFVSYRETGVMIYDISNLDAPVYKYFYYSSGIEEIALSKDNTFFVIAERHLGMKIVDTSDLTNMKAISSIYVEGRTYSVALIQNEQYVLVSSQIRGQLQLVDIRDKKNPVIVQMFNNKRFTSSNYVCLNQKQDIAYIALNQAIIIMNLYTQQQFNLDISLVKEGSKELKIKKILQPGDTMYAGQTLEIRLMQIYPTSLVKITDVSFYDNFSVYPLPSWAVFSQTDQKLVIEIVKDITDEQSTESASTQKQFIFQAKSILLKLDFYNLSIGITETLSNVIFEECLAVKIIDNQNMVIESSQEIIKKAFSSYTSSQSDYILYILKNKIFYYPITINLKPSISYTRSSSNQLIIESISDTLKLTITSNKLEAKLLKVIYPNVLTYYTSDQDEMRLEGGMNLIKGIIQNGGFRLANFTSPDKIQLTMTLDDSINYPIVINFLASDSALISLNQPVLLNSEKTLQQDFSDQFIDSSVYILESFTYAISNSVFKDADDDEIIYEAKIMIDGEYQIIPDSYWITFQSSEKRFTATTKASQYLSTIRLKVIGSDGFTQIEDYLEIQINNLPLWYVLQIICQVLGPIIGILGLWKYKALLCNFYNKNKLTSHPIIFYANSGFSIQIPLLENNLEKAKYIWKEYFKQQIKDDIKFELLEVLNKQISILQNENTTNRIDIYSNNTLISPKVSARKIIKLNRSFSKIENNSPMKDQESILKNTVKKMEQKMKRAQSFHQSTIMKYQPQQPEQSKYKYFLPTNELNKAYILLKVFEFCKSHPKLKNEQIINQLNNLNSKLSKCIIGLCVTSFCDMEVSIKSILDYMIKMATTEGFSTQEWYKAYVNILPQPDLVFDNPFPLLIYSDDKINNILKQLQSNKYINTQFLQGIPNIIPFIKECIEAYAFGTVAQATSFLNKNRGECLEVFTHNIHSIKTYRPVQGNGIISSIFQKQKEMEKELFQNSLIPSWIDSIDICNGVILLMGKIQNKDIGTYILKIFDTQLFILKSIQISINPELENQNSNQDNSPSSITVDRLFNEMPFEDQSVNKVIQSQFQNFDK